MKKFILSTFATLTFVSVFSQTGLIGSYPFSGNANDVSGSGNNGVVNGATLTADRWGNANSAYLFNGINSYIDLGLNYSYNSHSIACWCRKDSADGPNQLISKVNNGPYDTQNSELYLNAYAIGDGSSWNSVVTNAVFDPSQWNFIVGSYEAVSHKLKIYVNGICDSTMVSTYSDVTNTPVYVGARPFWSGTGSTTFYFKGAIDDVNIYNTAITQQQVDSLYNYNPVSTGIQLLNNESKIGVYPNPTTSTFTLVGISKSDLEKVEVYDYLGKLLFVEANNTNIDLSKFEKGMYLYRVYSTSGVQFGKIIKN